MKTLIVILYNIRSTYNVGAILRTCDCLGVSRAIFSGYTPFLDKGLPHEQAKLKKAIHKTALGAEDTVTWQRFDDIHAAIGHLRNQGIKIYALEQGATSQNLAEPQDFPDSVALILGEEVHGIPQDILDECDGLLEIPMCGSKESFNVSVATGIALWELRQPELADQTYLRN
ncbi:TrmH family RNA methyltransferase [Candidatus Saccharibacteria bacterium]|nr:TrmH family RNA methyltransferase [Candidatus Saccharibacteria bacterium]